MIAVPTGSEKEGGAEGRPEERATQHSSSSGDPEEL
jgi:hypothetical protein